MPYKWLKDVLSTRETIKYVSDEHHNSGSINGVCGTLSI